MRHNSQQFQLSQFEQPLAETTASPNSSPTSSLQAGMVLQLADATVIACNSAAEKLLGYTATQLIGATSFDPPWQTIYPDGSPFPSDEYPSILALKTGKPSFGVVLGFYRPAGDLIWLQLDTNPLFQANSTQPYAVVTTINEIPAPATTENSQYEKLRLFAKYAPVSMAICDRTMHYLAVSQRWVDMYQLGTITAVLGKSHYNIFPQMPDHWKQAHQQGMAGITQNCENDVFTLPDGSQQFLRWEIQPWYNQNNQIGGITLFVEDITERQLTKATLQQSEARYRCLAELIPQLVWTSNPAGLLLDVNQRWLDYTGLTLAQVQTQGWQAIIHPDDLPLLIEQWINAQATGSRYQAVGRIKAKDGSYRWHLHQAIAQTNQQQQVLQWYGTATDIEAQKQLEAERDRILQLEQAAREEAERANRIKDQFLAILSHELRSPLNPILGWTRLLQSRKLSEARIAEALATIERNAKLQAQLIEDLLDISRVMQGKMTLNATPLQLGFVIGAAIETVRLTAEAKNLQIKTNISKNVGEVFGDASRLQQVIWNLVSNAVKFTPPAGTITIELTQVGNEAQIQVQDTGKGINPEFVPYVFEYFRQEDGSTTRNFGGLGLGLAIADQIVEMHGGRIWAASHGENQGATFTVRLPLLKGTTSEPENFLTEQALPVTASSLSGIRALVVDDDTDAREFLEFLLQANGATVITAASASDALQILQQSQPDILLSDIGMPEMDGYGLMRKVRSWELAKNLPAIALTAYAGDADQKQAISAGFQRHVAKPINPDAVVAMITELLQR